MATPDDVYDEDRRLREMGIDPDGDPGEIMREVATRYRAVRAKYESEPDVPVIVDTPLEPCEPPNTATTFA